MTGFISSFKFIDIIISLISGAFFFLILGYIYILTSNIKSETIGNTYIKYFSKDINTTPILILFLISSFLIGEIISTLSEWTLELLFKRKEFSTLENNADIFSILSSKIEKITPYKYEFLTLKDIWPIILKSGGSKNLEDTVKMQYYKSLLMLNIFFSPILLSLIIAISIFIQSFPFKTSKEVIVAFIKSFMISFLSLSPLIMFILSYFIDRNYLIYRLIYRYIGIDIKISKKEKILVVFNKVSLYFSILLIDFLFILILALTTKLHPIYMLIIMALYNLFQLFIINRAVKYRSRANSLLSIYSKLQKAKQDLYLN